MERDSGCGLPAGVTGTAMLVFFGAVAVVAALVPGNGSLSGTLTVLAVPERRA